MGGPHDELPGYLKHSLHSLLFLKTLRLAESGPNLKFEDLNPLVNIRKHVASLFDFRYFEKF